MFQTFLTEPLANGLILVYKVTGGNFGIAIIVFTLILKFLLNPLTKPYMESMKRMKDLAPQLEKIKKKHKGNSVKLAQAQSEFYKSHGIKPGSGCLPYLLQIVVLIAFFNVFTKTLGSGSPTDNFNNLLYPVLKFTEGQTLNTSFLYLDLTKPDIFNLGLPFPFPGPLIFLAAFLQFLSAKIMQPFVSAEEKVAKKTKEKSDDMQVAMQQSMIYTFPLMTLVIGVSFASALALYWLVFSLSQFYQQYRTSGWGSLTPWLIKLNLIESGNLAKEDQNDKQNSKRRTRAKNK